MTFQFPFFLVAGPRIPSRRLFQSQECVAVQVDSEARSVPLPQRLLRLFPLPVVNPAAAEESIHLLPAETDHPEGEARLFGDDVRAVSLDAVVDVDQDAVRLLFCIGYALLAIAKALLCCLPYRLLADGTSLTATDLEPRRFGFTPGHDNRVYRFGNPQVGVAVWRKPLPFPLYSCTIHRAKPSVTVSNESTFHPVSGILSEVVR